MVRTCGVGCFALVELEFLALGKAVLRYVLGGMWTAGDYFLRKKKWKCGKKLEGMHL